MTHNHACPTCRKVFTCVDRECSEDDPCYECLRAERDAAIEECRRRKGWDQDIAHWRERAAKAEARLIDCKEHYDCLDANYREMTAERDHYEIALNEIAFNNDCDPRAEARHALEGKT